MRLLDLFCGAGGAAMGYHRAGFEVVGVDNRPMPRYPFTFVQADALEYLAAHGHEFDAIHASPPCQRYSEATHPDYRNNHPDLIGSTRDALQSIGKPYVIENVEGALSELRSPVTLCGSMFGLRIWRHRLFETWPEMFALLPPHDHSFAPILITGMGQRLRCGKRYKSPIAEKRVAIQIDWMTFEEITEAIPPAYTEYIGRCLMAAIAALEPSP